MIVTLPDKLAQAILHKTANRGQSKFRKRRSPFRLQRLFRAWRHGKKQLVVFAVLQTVFAAATLMERKIYQVYFKTDSARSRQPGQIAGETIAEVHHRVHREVLDEPATFGDARMKSQVSA